MRTRPSFGRVPITLAVVALLATLAGFAQPRAATAATAPFTDIAGTTFEVDIDWLFAEGITKGCSATLYCPNDPVTRGQMASFLVRMFDLPPTDADYFTDDDGTTHEIEINKLAASGITVGCTATTFCPTANVRRDEMASFLARAIPLAEGGGDNYFRDDDGTTHEANIDRTAAAGITTGCGTWRYCPLAPVTRGQMAGYLHRVEAPTDPPNHPAPAGPLTLHVATTGSNAGNDCFDAAKPCRTIRHALTVAIDGDAIVIGPGTFAEEDLVVDQDLDLRGDPGGGTVIDGTGNLARRLITIAAHRTVSLSRLTLTGGKADKGGAILNQGTLTITGSIIKGNRATSDGGGIYASGTLRISSSTIKGNVATQVGGGIMAWSASPMTLKDSIVTGNSAATGGGIGGSNLYIQRSTISGNAATGHGGGCWCENVRINGSTMSGNTAGGDGGGLVIFDPGDGTITNSTITNSTITANVAGFRGGGVANDVVLTVTNTTITKNTATSGGGGGIMNVDALDIRNSIIAGNAAGTGGNISGAISTKLASIVGIPAGLTLADILDPTGLADHGGPTKTIALTNSATNPARHKGDAATCAAAPVAGLDQRGMSRTLPCDIGAYELQP